MYTVKVKKNYRTTYYHVSTYAEASALVRTAFAEGYTAEIVRR